MTLTTQNFIDEWDRSVGSVVNNTSCSVKGPTFNPQQVHGGSRPSVATVPGDWTGMCGGHTWVKAKQSYTQIKNK